MVNSGKYGDIRTKWANTKKTRDSAKQKKAQGKKDLVSKNIGIINQTNLNKSKASKTPSDFSMCVAEGFFLALMLVTRSFGRAGMQWMAMDESGWARCVRQK